MLEKQESESLVRIVLTPNRSMSWQTNKKVLLCVLLVNLAIALVWASRGAWLVLPFAGLEVLLLGLGMYYVSWKLNFKEVITIEAESLTLQKGVYFPRQEWQWQLSQTTVVRRPNKYRMSAPNLYLKHLNNQIEIGDFLNRGEKKELLIELKQLGLITQNLKSA